jgi:hypothetical protein
LQDEESDMRRFVRRSAFALVSALGVAAAYAAWYSGDRLPSARLAKPHLPAVSMVDATLPRDSQAGRAVFGSPHAGDARCELIGCGETLAADSAEFCPVCLDSTDLMLSGLDPSGLDGAGTSLAATSLGTFAPELQGDPNSLYLSSIAPSALAAPTPEISTAAMLTLGFAGAAWIARRTRRATSKSSPEPCPC